LVAAARVAVVRARRPGRLLRVGRTAGPVPGTVLRRVALPCRGAADSRRRQIGRAPGRGRGARAGLRHVARARRRAADGPGVAGRVLASVVRPVALVAAARVAVVRARRPGWLLRVGRTAWPVPGTVLSRVALPCRGAADSRRR